jgi:uncharacterized protein (TIGR03086 family)
MQTIFALHRRATATAVLVVGAVQPVHLDHPTPCAGWDLRMLLEHMSGEDQGFAAAVRATVAGTDVDDAAFAPRPLGAAPATVHAAGAGAVVSAFADAAGLERPVLLPQFGHRFPLETVAGFHLIDTLVHGWDVAATLGTQDAYAAGLGPDLVAAGLAVAEQVPDGPAREAPGAAFAPALPTGASTDPWHRTLTLLGRDPAWTSDALVS